MESISLILDATKELRLSPTAFEGMYNLRLLKIYYPPFLKNPSKEQNMNRKRVGIHLPRGLHFLSSELRFLYWYNYPLKSLPSNFFPEKPFQLEMPCSQLEQVWNECQVYMFYHLLFLIEDKFEIIHNIYLFLHYFLFIYLQALENLKLMNPPSSKLSLIDSDLSKVPNLEVLHPGHCSSLAGIPSLIKHSTRLTRFESFCTLPSSIGCLSQLVRLNLSLCESLVSLPDNIDELKSLVELDLYSYSKLASLPNNICKLKCLAKLNLGRQPELAGLPDNIGDLRSLIDLNLSSCSGLASLPDSIGGLRSLTRLDLYGCSGLASLPDSIGRLKSLEDLDLSGCSRLASLPDNIGGLKSLKVLDLNGCSRLASLPNNIGALKSLQWLCLDGCLGLPSLPDSIGGLKSLKWLCSTLESLPDNIDGLKSLKDLDLYDFSGLASLPDSMCGWANKLNIFMRESSVQRKVSCHVYFKLPVKFQTVKTLCICICTLEIITLSSKV